MENENKAIELPQNVVDIPQEIINQAVDCLDKSIANFENYTNAVFDNDIKNKKGITIRSEQIIIKAIDFATQYPQLMSPMIDVNRWKIDLAEFEKVEPVAEKAEMLHDLAVKYQRIRGIDALKYFSFYYKCMRTLSEEGVEEAKIIYGVLSQFYGYLFGPKSKQECPVAILEATMEEAQRVLENNKHHINRVVSDESKLKRLISDDLAADKELATKDVKEELKKEP